MSFSSSFFILIHLIHFIRRLALNFGYKIRMAIKIGMPKSIFVFAEQQLLFYL